MITNGTVMGSVASGRDMARDVIDHLRMYAVGHTKDRSSKEDPEGAREVPCNPHRLTGYGRPDRSSVMTCISLQMLRRLEAGSPKRYSSKFARVSLGVGAA